MTLLIQGIGTALPEHSIDQDRAARMACALSAGSAQDERRVALLYRRSGVKRRHSVLLSETPNGHGDAFHGQSFYRPAAGTPNPTTRQRMEVYAERALPLAAEACRRAIDSAAVPPAAITHLITVSCSGFDAPGVDIRLIEALGLPPGVARSHVGFMGCHGALNGLRIANAFAADPAARILLCAVELCSLHYQYSEDADKHVANSLFADGAAALVGSSSSRNGWRLRASGSHLMPDSRDAMTWSVGDNGFSMTLSAQVPSLINQYLRAWIEPWLKTQTLSFSQIQTWAIHPGGPRILQSAGEALGLPAEALSVSRGVLAEHGNMSSPTILFLLDRLIRANAPLPCVALAFGPGLVVEAALFDQSP